ncbi:MAG: sensor domain-containing diguanylate cyclase [Terriglobales bacterium]
MDIDFHFDLRHILGVGEFSQRRQTWFVGILFAVLTFAQGLGFLALGTGRAGSGLSESILVLDSFLAVTCAWIAFRRARGVSAMFWFLFVVVLTVLLVPTAVQTYSTLFDCAILSNSNWTLLYCLYGAPILMMLFLPNTYRVARVKFEIFLDFFQIAIVVSLVYSTFFFLPVQRMLPADALLHNIRISEAQSLLLMAAILVRLQFARTPASRCPLLRLGFFLLVCSIVTFVGGWFALHDRWTALAWFDLGWAIPQAAAALVAISWEPERERQTVPEAANFMGLLGSNLVLVAMLSCNAWLTDRWKQAYGEFLIDVAITVSLFAFTLRLALTQFHQQQEIAQRETAQTQLTISNKQVGRLLDDARRQTAEITLISELGSLLQACTSREEVFRLIPERLRRLFPGASGCIALLSASRNRAESAAEWGLSPVAQIFSPEQCWALRRGCTHAHRGGHFEPRCSHLLGEGASICIPLIANGDAIGTLSLQDDDLSAQIPGAESDPDFAVGELSRRRQLAAAVAEHVSLAIANLGLRESLRVQAVRDPLTGLYNRRYMQEFLDHALHSARRKHRPLAVMMLDLDHFKRYNDSFGHSAGDRALSSIGEILLRSVRAEDIACRFGGEEFVLILPECSLRQAVTRAEEVRRRVCEHRGPADGPATDPLTVSIGVAAFDETTDRVDLLLKFADDALYQAKHAGRNRTVAARPANALPEPDLREAPPERAQSTN